MECILCGGDVEWKGKITNLTHTECNDCGGLNCQFIQRDEEYEIVIDDEEEPTPGGVND